jgi:ribosomal protein L37AE/L43A
MTDHQAEYGYTPTWDKQQRKQEQVAANSYSCRVSCPECGDSENVAVVGHETYSCFTCDTKFMEDDL